jgi:hypothetical protein
MKKPIPLPPAKYLRVCFIYDPETGILYWRKRPRKHFTGAVAWAKWNGQYAKTAAGTVTKACRGKPTCRQITLNYRSYKIHRIIWKYVTGKDPLVTIDHIDRDPCNNRWNNLREATHLEQARNKDPRRIMSWYINHVFH